MEVIVSKNSQNSTVMRGEIIHFLKYSRSNYVVSWSLEKWQKTSDQSEFLQAFSCLSRVNFEVVSSADKPFLKSYELINYDGTIVTECSSLERFLIIQKDSRFRRVTRARFQIAFEVIKSHVERFQNETV